MYVYVDRMGRGVEALARFSLGDSSIFSIFKRVMVLFLTSQFLRIYIYMYILVSVLIRMNVGGPRKS